MKLSKSKPLFLPSDESFVRVLFYTRLSYVKKGTYFLEILPPRFFTIDFENVA